MKKSLRGTAKKASGNGTSAPPGRSTGRVRLADVADAAGVGQMTVSRALNHPETVSDKLRTRILEVVENLGYVRDNRASALASGGARLIPVLIPTLHHSVYVSFLDGLYSVLKANNYEILLGVTEYLPEREESLLSAVLGWHPSGIVVAGLEHSPRAKKILKGAGIPVIEVMDHGSRPIDISVGFSHYAVGETVAAYLADLGHKHMAYAAASQNLDSRSEKRLNGFRKVLGERGLEDPIVESLDGPSSVQTGRLLLKQIRQKHKQVDAIFFTNDDLAAGAIFECLDRKIRVPGDIAIVGFNDLDIANEMRPSITSVTTPLMKIGTTAGQLLMRRLRNEPHTPRSIDLGFQLVERTSTRLPARKQ